MMWGGNPPDTLVVEIGNENYLDNWKGMNTFTPSINKRVRTMRAARGTAPQDFGTSNVILYVFVSMKALFEFSPKIDMYITPNGRIVTQSGLPWSAVVMIRRNNDENGIIDKNKVGLRPPPAAPGGPKRVKPRDSRGEPYPLNIARTPMPDGKIRTKSGKEYRTGFHNMLERMCDGPPWQQHMQLQMLKGVYKTEMCNYDARGKRCDKGDQCCFAHSTDNEYDIAAVVNPFRKKIFTELFDAEFSLLLEHLHEIGKITDQEFRIALQKKGAYEDRRRNQRPRLSRSPRSSSSDGDNRTPPPVDRSSGSGQGNLLPLTNTGEDSAERQRDHTSGDNAEDDDSDREEAAAPIEANDNDIKIEIPPETVQTSLHGNGDIDEPTPQLEQEAADTEMSTGPPIVDTDMSTGLPEIEA